MPTATRDGTTLRYETDGEGETVAFVPAYYDWASSNETIEVRVFDGGAVAENASVFLNDRAVGTTDSDGTVEVTLPASGDAKLTARDGDAEGELRLELDQRRGRGSELLRKLDVNAVLDGDLVTATVRYAGVGVANASVRANDRTVGRTNADGVVTEVEPRRALEAHMEGYGVLPMAEAAAEGDVFITTTGNRDVIVEEHFEAMQDGVLLANAGHFDVEINLDQLDDLAVDRYEARDGVEAYEMADGRRLNVLAEGRLVNLAAPIALGHPVEVMDQSFGVQAVCVRELVENGEEYDAGVHEVPDELDREVAEVKLAAEGVEFDDLSDEQREYMGSWQHGT